MAKRKNWIGIIAFPHPKPVGTRPYVLHLNDDDSDRVAVFETVDEIRDIKRLHVLGDGEWTAFNFESGETIEL